MIISASRRTDIPAYYSEWFYNRIKDGHVLVRNPMNAHQVGSVRLSPDVVDGIVFWTKNPVPMMDRLSELDAYNYYFQFTLTPYGRDVESNLPSKSDVLVPTFQRLSRMIGREKVVWRYDPIFFNEHYTTKHHCKCFEILASRLGEYTEKCTVSFLDLYANTARNVRHLHILHETDGQRLELMQRFAEIADKYGIYIDTCAEKINLEQYGISHACCIDKARLERIGQCGLSVEKDKNQRPECGCVSSIDIGSYNTCGNGCAYCYANFNSRVVAENMARHDPVSPLLFGKLAEDDIVRERKMESLRDGQMTMFDL